MNRKTKIVFKPRFKKKLKTETEQASFTGYSPSSEASHSEASHFQLNNTFAKGYLRSWVIEGRENERDLIRFFETFKPKIEQKLREELQEMTNIKYQICVKVKMKKNDENSHPYFHSKQNTILNISNIPSSISQSQQKIQETLEKWTQNGSGWIVQRVEEMYINVAKYNPFRGGSYIPTPKYYSNKKAIINVQNKKDDDCLRWALRSWKASKEAERENYPPQPPNKKTPRKNFKLL